MKSLSLSLTAILADSALLEFDRIPSNDSNDTREDFACAIINTNQVI